MRKLEDRNKPGVCPSCSFSKCSRAYLSAPRVIWFPGSFTYDDRSAKLDKMAKEAQAEGFRSQDEVDIAVGQAKERAKQLGIPVEKILGGTKAPFEGKLSINPNDAAKHKKLYQEYVEKGILGKDIKGAAKAKAALSEFETQQRKKHKDARKYKPTDRAKDIVTAKSQSKNFSKQV